MSFHITVDSLEEAHHDILSYLSDGGEFESAPRGKPIREALGASFVLTDPRNRLINSPARNVNYGFAVGELCWYVRADTDLETMLYYNKRMAQFSDDGETINSAYGARMFDGCEPLYISQFENVVAELRHDPDSRRAVMLINQPTDLQRAVVRGSKDVPCTLSLQLFIRNRRLHMHAVMRSNDAVWGLPYDVFSFTCLQEGMLYRLQEEGVPVDDLGTYRHTAGSLHVYDTHFDLAKEVAGESLPRPTQMKPFTLEGLRELADEWEPAIRAGYPAFDPTVNGATIEWMVARLIDHRAKRNREKEKIDSAS